MATADYRHLVTLRDLDPAQELEPATWYCAIQPTAGAVSDGQAPCFMRGRYHPGITLETQVIFEGRTFQVQGVTDVDERHIELQLTCVEVVARGREPHPA
jgi:hypothetical protein